MSGCSSLPIGIPEGQQQESGEEQTLETSALYLKAQRLYDSGRFEEAIRVWEQIPPGSPQYLDAQLGIRNARLKLDEIAQEESDSSANYDELDRYIERAERLEYEGNIREALELYEEARLLAPENILLHNKIEELHEILDDSIERHRALGELYMSRGEYEKARSEWEGLLDIDASNALAKQRLEDLEVLTATSDKVFVQRGRALMQRGLLNEAKSEFQKALKVNAGNERTRSLLRNLDSIPFTEYTVKAGDTLSSIAASYTDDATDYLILKDFNELEDETPLRIGQALKIPHVLAFRQALAPDETDMLDEVSQEEDSQEVREIMPTVPSAENDGELQILFEQALEAYAAKNFREALSLFNQVYSRDPNNVEAYNYFLQSLAQLREESAEVELSSGPEPRTLQPPELVEPAPSETDNLRASAAVQQESGNLKEAIRLLEEAGELEPNNAEIVQELETARDEMKKLITDHLNEGIKLFNQEALEEAIQEWDKVLDLDPANKQAAKYREQAEKRLNALKAIQ
jgi:tetratricopeptide (TPR) repeat protein